MFSLNDMVLTDIDGAFTVLSPKGRQATITKRKSYGLSFCIEGQITYTHNGKSFVSDKTCAVILPKGQTYSLYGDKKGVFTVINFDCDRFACSTVRLIPIKSAEPYIKDFERIKALLLFDESRTKIFSIFYDMLYRLLSSSSVKEPLAGAMKYIEMNYSDPSVTNERVAKACNISEVYLRKLFVRELNTTPRHFINELRIQKAKQLLADGIMKVNAVAQACGFSSPYHFCRTFKEKTGCTPSEYIKQNQIGRL